MKQMIGRWLWLLLVLLGIVTLASWTAGNRVDSTIRAAKPPVAAASNLTTSAAVEPLGSTRMIAFRGGDRRDFGDVPAIVSLQDTPTVTATVTTTVTASPTVTATATVTTTATVTGTATTTATVSPSATPSATVTVTGTATTTPTVTATASPTGTVTPSPTATTSMTATVFIPTVRNAYTDVVVGGFWRTGLQVVNLSRDATLRIQIRYVDSAGNTAATQVTPTLGPGESQTYFGASMSAPEGFNGSAIITANGAIGVVANQLTQDTGLTGSFNGVTATGRRVFVPIALRGANATDLNTSLFIQNAGDTQANAVSVRFYRRDQIDPAVTIPLNDPIPPGATRELNQALQQAELDQGFEGSAVVESDQPVAIVVNQSNGRTLMSSTGQPDGFNRLFGPLVMNNNNGFNSTVIVQNTGNAVTSVTVSTFRAGSGERVSQETRTIAPGAATNWTTAQLARTGERFIGSVTVDVASGGSAIGLVNQLNVATNQGSAYALFAGGSATIVAPLVQTANNGFNTGFQVQNVGSRTVDVTVVVTETSGRRIDVPNQVRSIAPGESETWFPITELGTRVIGSATAFAIEGSQLVGVVNQLNQEAGAVDFFSTYETLPR